MAKRNSLLLTFIIVTSSLSQLNAQTTLSGDHVITGKLNVGATGALGGVEVSGQTGNTAVPGLKITGDGGVVFEGTYGTGTLPAIQGGAYMMWYPKKAAFRAGNGGMDDQDAFIGEYSTAFGEGAIAAGGNSFAVAGSYVDIGNRSVGLGGTVFSSSDSAVMSGGTVIGSTFSTAMSQGSVDVGSSYSTAMSGGYIDMFSSYSTALSGGFVGGYPDGTYSTAINGAISESAYTFVSGQGVYSRSYCSFVIGAHNTPPFQSSEHPSEWVEEESLFVIGNGTGKVEDPLDVRYRSALVVRKNGNSEFNGDVQISGKVVMPRQGDIEMGDFGTPGSGD